MRGDLNRHGMRGGTRKKRGEGSLLVSFARGTRALRRASFDARRRGRLGSSLVVIHFQFGLQEAPLVGV
jgi:hypothetical protein